MSSATLQKIDAQLERLDPESLRFKLLAALRQFRASWIDLGRLLNQLALDRDYEEWGYENFDLYCARELGLKRPTVQKLMVSYNYMKSHEPARLHAFEDAFDRPVERPADRVVPDMPDYETVALLDRARRRGNFGDDDDGRRELDSLHRRVFDGGGADGDGDETELRRELRDRLRPAGRPDAGLSAGRELSGILRMARTLRQKLAAAPSGLLPAALRERLENDLAELEGVQVAD